MSIALSVVLHSSKKLQILAILFSLFLALVGIYIGSSASLPVFVRTLLGATCVVISVANFLRFNATLKKHWHIAIDGQGIFRCLQLSGKIGDPGRSDLLATPSYYLATGTVLWSQLLILRLRRLEDDNMINLMVLSDSVNADEFRRLAVACHWVAGQEKSGKN